MKRKKGGENEEMENKETMKKDKKKRKKYRPPAQSPQDHEQQNGLPQPRHLPGTNGSRTPRDNTVYTRRFVGPPSYPASPAHSLVSLRYSLSETRRHTYAWTSSRYRHTKGCLYP